MEENEKFVQTWASFPLRICISLTAIPLNNWVNTEGAYLFKKSDFALAWGSGLECCPIHQRVLGWFPVRAGTVLRQGNQSPVEVMGGGGNQRIFLSLFLSSSVSKNQYKPCLQVRIKKKKKRKNGKVILIKINPTKINNTLKS